MPSPRKILNFKIQLLSGNSVVLVECPGFESELFLPQIVKGRINFQNIIPNRRCCDAANVTTSPLIYARGLKGSTIITPVRSAPELLKLADPSLSTPLARSTPSSTTTVRMISGKENLSPLQLTPEHVRCITPAALSTIDVVSLPSIIGASQRLTPEPPRLLPRGLDSSADLRSSLPVSPSYPISIISSTDDTLAEVVRKSHTLRTYSRKITRRPHTSPQLSTNNRAKSTCSWPTSQKKKKSSTKTPNPAMKLEIRTRKLIVDSKKSLGAHDPNKVVEAAITKKKILKKQVTSKTRKQFEALKVTAHDMLTMPAQEHLSKDLTSQFKLACMDKAATTLPNYAEVAAVAPLKMDREVISVLAKQKRLQKPRTKASLMSLTKCKRI